MKYYVVEKIVDYESKVLQLLFIVEHEEIAIDVVKRYPGMTYTECDTEENKDD